MENNPIESTVIGSNSINSGWEVPPEAPDEANSSASSLVPCPLCERKFMSDRLDKHITICQKLKEKKRKQFDSTKMRVENLDKINNYPTEIILNQNNNINNNNNNKTGAAAKNGKKNQTKPEPAKPTGNKSNWRAQHQEFIRTIRAARGETVKTDEDHDNNNNGVKAIPPGFVECPSCNRRFSDRAAERHLPWCADKQRNQQSQQANNKANNQEAMERMKARTKYKPTNNLQTQDRSQSRSRSSSTSSKHTTICNDKPNTSGPPASSKSIGSSSSSNYRKPTTINRKYTKNISKSTENIRHKVTNSSASWETNRKKSSTSTNSVKSHQQPPPQQQYHSRTNSKRTENQSNHSVDRNQTMLLRKNANFTSGSYGGSAGHYNMKNVQSKINTGLKSPNKATVTVKKSDPVMKFKEKFPNHQQRNNSTQQYDFELLRRNSSEYDNSPKTVPGVRTGAGGVSPVKSTITSDEKSSLAMSRSETNLNEIGGDIKKRIDMYINGLYDNELLNNYANGFKDNSFDNNKTVPESELVRQTAVKRHLSTEKLLMRDHSINSDDLNGNEARGSTSDSTDSGLGVIFPNGSITSKDSMTNGSNRDNVNGRENYPREIVSPPMSDVALERSSRLMMLNSSLNDLHLIGGKNIEFEEPGLPPMDYHYHHQQRMQSETPPAVPPDLPIPRFCHNCGTKYPNTLAKFCYECGNRRFGAVV